MKEKPIIDVTTGRPIQPPFNYPAMRVYDGVKKFQLRLGEISSVDYTTYPTFSQAVSKVGKGATVEYKPKGTKWIGKIVKGGKLKAPSFPVSYSIGEVMSSLHKRYGYLVRLDTVNGKDVKMAGW